MTDEDIKKIIRFIEIAPVTLESKNLSKAEEYFGVVEKTKRELIFGLRAMEAMGHFND